MKKNLTPKQEMKAMTRRGLIWSAISVAFGYGALRWFDSRDEDSGLIWPMRQALRTNERIWRDLFKDSSHAQTFPATLATMPIANGDYGLDDNFDPSGWTLTLADSMADDTTTLSLADIKKLPVQEQVTELRCIEGWSTIVSWKGCRLADFIKAYPPQARSGNSFDPKNKKTGPEYVGIQTPSDGYYVGLDFASAMHPQTLLAWEMNGQPLTLDHGAPLRLVIPTKYGVKNIKRIGTITYSDDRPADYWAEQGYDWYAGL